MNTAAPSNWALWDTLTREELKDRADNALVVVPIGAIEQHGPFVATGADITMSTHVVEAAAKKAAVESSDTNFIVAPFLRIGCSAHHLSFGGTITISPDLMIRVLVESLQSMEATGIKRIVLVNGHGGNTGVMHAAASEAASNSSIAIAALDYWEFSPEEVEYPQPGHAGFFETSLLLATRPDLVRERRPRELPGDVKTPGRAIYGSAVWDDIDGYTDVPELANAEIGEKWLEHIENGMAKKFLALVAEM